MTIDATVSPFEQGRAARLAGIGEEQGALEWRRGWHVEAQAAWQAAEAALRPLVEGAAK